MSGVTDENADPVDAITFAARYASFLYFGIFSKEGPQRASLQSNVFVEELDDDVPRLCFFDFSIGREGDSERPWLLSVAVRNGHEVDVAEVESYRDVKQAVRDMFSRYVEERIGVLVEAFEMSFLEDMDAGRPHRTPTGLAGTHVKVIKSNGTGYIPV